MSLHIRINCAYDPLRDLNSRYMVLYGGRRSSKSWSTSQLLVRKACLHIRRIVVLRKFATSIRYSVWDRVFGAIAESVGLGECQINKGERRITLPNGSEFIFVGADDPEKLKSIEGVTDYWLEEATEFEEHDFNVLDAGMSTPCDPPPQFWLTFNPVPVITGYKHWLQERFLGIEHKLGVIRTEGMSTIFRTWYQNNLFCPQETVDLLNSYEESNPDLWKMWGLGEFTHLKGAILKNWDVVKKAPDLAPLGFGMDFGFANDPAAVVKVWMNRREIWIEEQVFATGLTNPDLSEAMEAVGMKKKSDNIRADSAEPKSIEELRRMGWIISGAKKYQNYKREAALFLQGYTIHVVEPSPNVQREIATWSWKQDKEGHIVALVADGNDHTVDAVIYRTFQRKGVIDPARIERQKTDGVAYMKKSTLAPAAAAIAI